MSCRLLALLLSAAAVLAGAPATAVAAPPSCLTNLVANVFAGNPTVLPAAPCSDPDGDPLTIILVSGPDHGVLSAQAADGTRTYTGAADYVGSDVVRFKASDGTSESAISTLTINVQAPPAGPAVNRPPVANPDAWTVKPGLNVDESVLLNDSDPDGDAITARVLSISFAAREWSGMDPDGGFLYVAGPGTKRNLRKTITYVAVDSHGQTSAPATAVVTVSPPVPAKRSPLRSTLRAKSAAAGVWEGPYSSAQLCFGSGLKASCFTMLSVRQTQELNRLTAWTDLPGAAQACLKYGLLPMKNKACAKELLKRGVGKILNKAVISSAVHDSSCLLFRIARRRTLAHPLAGEWGKPEYNTTESVVRPFNGNHRTSGYGTWTGAVSGTEQSRVPLLCESDTHVYRMLYQSLIAIG